MTRTPGLRGRLPVKPPAERFPLSYLSDYLRQPLPAPVYPIDVTGGIAPNEWAMLANGPDPTCTTHPNGVGDCGFAARQHARMAKAASYRQTETWETSDQLVAEYLRYDHGQDVGVNLADVLLTWYRKGIIKAFAPVDHTDPAAIDSAMEAFKGVLVGVTLTDDAEQLFSENLPWTIANGQQPDSAEGHAIVKVRADGRTLDDYVTWGCMQGATLAWSAAAVQEVWVALTSEDEVAKVNMPALLADINALHGTGDPAPAPAPVPAPIVAPPGPAGTPTAPSGLLQDLAARARWVATATGQDYRGVVEWLRAHRP